MVTVILLYSTESKITAKRLLQHIYVSMAVTHIEIPIRVQWCQNPTVSTVVKRNANTRRNPA